MVGWPSAAGPGRVAVVVGGGIGGLAAARALQLAGWQVNVLEQAERLDALGAGISLWPNAMHALRALEAGFPARTRQPTPPATEPRPWRCTAATSSRPCSRVCCPVRC